MSVEIRELVIRASVSERAAASEKDPCECDDEPSEEGAAAAATAREDVVRAAVREVLRILKAERER